MSKLNYFCDNKRHLICEPYSIHNLHLMAIDLGINICWLHGGKFPHYDIPKSRIEEITKRCKLISSKELLLKIKHGQSKIGKKIL